jgi:hypothetical protein
VNAHVLIFECPKCGRPMPLIRLDQSTEFPDKSTAIESLNVACAGWECRWSGTMVAALCKHHWTVSWSHAHSPAPYKQDIAFPQ